jgi:hypothetical protein
MISWRRRKRWPPICLLLILLAIPANADFDEQSIETDPQPAVSMRSPVDCDFDLKLDNNGMCSWKPSSEDSSKASIWHTGNSVLVDSANSIVKSAMGG